ncbi:sulfotransferase [Candidatus Nomurabacteria bacterium]|nr:sulfotransferase [Candidatus Nomurabacteria bacterium]
MKISAKKIAICVGSQKAGTSWLFKCLEEHPEVCGARGKETNFFTKDTSDTSDYYHLYNDCNHKPVFFEASPLYLYDKDAPQRIKASFPDAKIIILLRDPVERTLSHFRHIKNNGHLKESVLVESAVVEFPELIEYSLYTKWTGNYAEVFPKEQVLFIDYKEICNKPQNVIDKVCDFLDIATFTPNFLHTKYNTSAWRANPLFKTITRIYLFLNKSETGKKIIDFLRKINIKSDTVESFLSKTARKNRVETDSERVFLKEKLQQDILYYQTLFSEKIQ